MSIINTKTKPHKYLVCAIYRSRPLINELTRIEHVGIVLAHSPFSAITIVSRTHNPDGEKPSKYVASLILGPFQVNAFSNQLSTCEELLSIRKG